MIYLQSFFSPPKGIPLSVARWQPKNYPTIEYFQPFDEAGKPIKGIPPEKYLIKYTKTLIVRAEAQILHRKEAILNGPSCSLCCWCNPQRQKGYKTLFCHTILIGYLLELLIPELKVEYLDGRENPVWSREEFLDVYNNLKEGQI